MRHHAFAAAMGLATAALLAPCSQSQAATADPTGYWYKPDAERESKIQVFKCGAGKSQLCAKIIWLKDPKDSGGRALHDIRNEDPSLRGRPIVGLTIFAGLMPSAPATWTGKIYNPEDGHTYAATLTMVSRTQITLRGCKAWLLCGEKQWLRTSPPPAAVPTTAPEGTEQIEASATPNHAAPAAATAATPAIPAKAEAAPGHAVPTVEAAVDHSAPVDDADAAPAAPPPAAVEASAASAPQAMAQPVALVSPAPPPVQNTEKGYGFLNASMTSESAAKYSGDNVSSMFSMTAPLPTEAGTQPVPTQPAPAAAPAATQAAADQTVPMPSPKPKAKAQTQVVASKSAAKATQDSAAGQGAPVPDEGATAQAEADTQSAQADASDVEPVPLTRRQLRKLRRQQEIESGEREPLFPWLR
jgi:uncharacterized protein (DUF2147 family)